MVTALLGSSEMDGHGQVLHCDARVRISSKATRGIEREKDRLLASVLTSGAMSANWSSPCQEQKRRGQFRTCDQARGASAPCCW